MGQTEVPKPDEAIREMRLPPEKFALVRGRIVQYQDNYDGEPCPAIVTHVWPNENERLVNLTVFTRDGEPRAAVRVYRGASVGTWRPPGAKE